MLRVFGDPMMAHERPSLSSFTVCTHSCRNLLVSNVSTVFSIVFFGSLRLRRSFSLRSSFYFRARDLKIKSQLVTVKISFYVPFLNASVLALPELHHGEVRTLRSSRQPPQSNGHPFQKVSGEF